MPGLVMNRVLSCWVLQKTRVRLNSGPLDGYQIAPSIYFDQLSTDRSRGTLKVYTSTL